MVRWLVYLCLAACLGGCCVAPPLPAKFFDRAHPEHTLNGFVYAVDTHQWDYAYASLAASSQKEWGFLKFKSILLFVDDPVFDQPIFDIISNTVPGYGEAEFLGGNTATVVVVSTVRDDGQRFDFGAALFFEKDKSGDWRFDIIKSITCLQQQMLQAKSPPVHDLTQG
jgi:hypothetical protein